MSTAHLIEKFPAHKLDDARHALALAHARLVRSAAKAGQTAPTAPKLTVKAEHVMSRCAICKTAVDGWPPAGHVCFATNVVLPSRSWTTITLLDLELVAERPVLAGWTFLAAVEPLDGGNLIRQVPGADVVDGELARWATGAIACDHCQAKRRRVETFIVRADGTDPSIPAGTYKQVGRQCVASFLGGKSPVSIVAQLGWPDVVRGVSDEDGEGGWGSSSAALYEPASFLALTAAVIRLDGWCSRGSAETSGTTATADRVLSLLTPPFADPRGDWRRDVERCTPNTDDIERGAAALAWATALPGASDYERNLALVSRQKGIKREHAGILASAISAYTRELGREVERARQGAANASNPSQHIGEIGARMNLELTVQRCVMITTDYGALNIISMRDSQNNLYVWKTGAENPKPGEQLKIRGSVKKHDEYRGEKQTILTRCEIVDEFPTAKPARKRSLEKGAQPCRWRVGDNVSFAASPTALECRTVYTGKIERIDAGELAPIAYVRACGHLSGVSPGYLHAAGAFEILQGGPRGIRWTDENPE